MSFWLNIFRISVTYPITWLVDALRSVTSSSHSYEGCSRVPVRPLHSIFGCRYVIDRTGLPTLRVLRSSDLFILYRTVLLFSSFRTKILYTPYKKHSSDFSEKFHLPSVWLRISTVMVQNSPSCLRLNRRPIPYTSPPLFWPYPRLPLNLQSTVSVSNVSSSTNYPLEPPKTRPSHYLVVTESC